MHAHEAGDAGYMARADLKVLSNPQDRHDVRQQSLLMYSGARTAAPTVPYGAKAGSVRSKQSIGWAKKAANAPSSAAGFDDALPVSKTRRIFVYVIGGITHRQRPRPSASLWRDHLQVSAQLTGQGCELTAHVWEQVKSASAPRMMECLHVQ